MKFFSIEEVTWPTILNLQKREKKKRYKRDISNDTMQLQENILNVINI